MFFNTPILNGWWKISSSSDLFIVCSNGTCMQILNYDLEEHV